MKLKKQKLLKTLNHLLENEFNQRLAQEIPIETLSQMSTMELNNLTQSPFNALISKEAPERTELYSLLSSSDQNPLIQYINQNVKSGSIRGSLMIFVNPSELRNIPKTSLNIFSPNSNLKKIFQSLMGN
jgi:hypothetical protein